MSTAIATTTNSRRRRRNAEPEYKSKSDWMRALFAAPTNPATGKPWMVDEVAVATSSNYAFVHGVANRAGYHDRTGGRKARAVAIDKTTGVVTVQTTGGPVVVSPDGTIVGGHRPVRAPKSPKPTATVEA